MQEYNEEFFLIEFERAKLEELEALKVQMQERVVKVKEQVRKER